MMPILTPLQKAAAVAAAILLAVSAWQGYGAWERHKGREQARQEQEVVDNEAVRDANQAERELRARGDDDPARRLRSGDF